jgi:hypothetical protein
MRATITKALAMAGFLTAVAAAPAIAQGHPGHGHGDTAPRAGMMQGMTGHCPMAGGEIMSPEALLGHAEDLELNAEQVAELEVLRDRHAQLRAQMMEGTAAAHDLLTPEQLEALPAGMHARVGGMMGGMDGMEGTQRATPGMMHGMRHGEMPEGRMGMSGPGTMPCPMTRGGGAEQRHRHPGNEGEG